MHLVDLQILYVRDRRYNALVSEPIWQFRPLKDYFEYFDDMLFGGSLMALGDRFELSFIPLVRIMTVSTRRVVTERLH
jgi:hypothetical protein